ncbi:MAG: hypothetical protein ABJG88_13115 [Litorimonas sp.]
MFKGLSQVGGFLLGKPAISKYLALSFFSSILFLSACATTGGPSSNSAGAIGSKSIDRTDLSTEFVQLENGGKYHPRTGLLCPPVIGGMTLERDNKYGTNGNNVSCGHSGEGRELTTYLYPAEGFDFRADFQGAAQAITQARPEQKFVHDPDFSQVCTLQGLLLQALVVDEGHVEGDARANFKDDNVKDSNAYTYETAIFTNDTLLTALTLHEVDGQFLKLRYTELIFDTSDEVRRGEICRMLANVTKDRHNDVFNPPKL